MKIGILTCMWRRPEVFRMFAAGMNRLKSKFDIITLSVGSEGAQSRQLCQEAGINYLEFPNKPLGAKFNAGMSVMKSFNPDYVMIMGSDDVLSTATFQKIWDYCEKGCDKVGFTDLYFFDLYEQSLVYWPGYGHKGTKADSSRKGEAIGLGRTLSYSILNKMNWHPWKDDINMGLDWCMTQKLKALRTKPIIFSLKENGLFAVDLKSKENICHSILYVNQKVDNRIFYSHIPENEIRQIMNYRNLFYVKPTGILRRDIRTKCEILVPLFAECLLSCMEGGC